MAVERKLLSFPGLNTARVFVACGMPGPAGQLASIQPSTSALSANFAGKAQDGAHRLDLPRPHEIAAITIASDSAIHACDIAMGGNDGEASRFRVSPGNPLILPTADDAEFATVTIPISIPEIDLQAQDVAWDSAPYGIDTTTGFTTGIQFPLRLEVWRNSLPVRGIFRSVYAGYSVFALNSAVQGTGAMWICVDGRRKVDVIVSIATGGGTVTVSADAIEALRQSTNSGRLDIPKVTNLPLSNAGNLTDTVGGGVANPTKTFSFDGNPMAVMRVNLSIPAGACTAHVQIKAYD